MKILFATSECAPYSKSGGLADVAYSLPPALKAEGNEIAVITPLYKCVKDKYMDQLKKEAEYQIPIGDTEYYCGLYRGNNQGVTMWFIDNEMLFNRPKLYGYYDDAFRFAFFSKAIVELILKLDFVPDMLHCNDWETALAIIYLRNDQTWNQAIQGIRTTYTIHNMAYQGQFGASALQEIFALPEGWYDGGLGYEYEGRHDINLMKGAMLMSDLVSTVSPTYARELHVYPNGHGLEGVVNMVENKMYGILNGIDMDLYDPAKDTRIVKNFSVKDMSGKAECKASIQKKFGLVEEEGWPLFCSVARLVEQKGIELVKQILPDLMNLGLQVIVFGQGDQEYIDYFNWAASNWPGQFGFSSDYTEEVASEIFAGSDFYLMPSRFEPCGLSQMMAMRYGTVPIVHAVGGLKDSVRGYRSFDGVGDGFSFSGYNSKELYLAILQAVRVYFADNDTFNIIRERCMTKDLSWKKSALLYMQMFSEVCSDTSGDPISFEEAFKTLKRGYRRIEKKRREVEQIKMSDDFHLAIEFQIIGRGAGVFYIEFTGDKMDVQPYGYNNPDAKIVASYDHFLGLQKGTVSGDKLFMSGQLKITGNLSLGMKIRSIFEKGPKLIK